MQVIYHKKFEKDLALLEQTIVIADIILFIEKIYHVKSFNLIFGYDIKKMKASKNFFRVRFGDYRLGFELSGNAIILRRILHRKVIYKKFP